MHLPQGRAGPAGTARHAWGNNYGGEAGVDPDVAGYRVLSPVPVHEAAADVTQLSGSPVGKTSGFVLSLRSDGTVWGWGLNGSHQLPGWHGSRV